MYALGIDLGTVFTAAATWRDGHAEIATLGSRAASIPSVVLLRDDDSFLTGEAANRRALLQPGRVAREFKRRFGDATPILLGGTPYSAESLMAKLLGTVVADVTAREGEPPAAVCLCHPANWGPYKTDLLRQAVRMADLRAPVTMAVEPAAAAAYYARQTRIEAGSVVAVYDLGGGTFDAAVLRKTTTGFEIIGRPEGIEHLGGADFDAAVFHHVRSVIGPQLDALDDTSPTTVAAVARLREECTEAKEMLSSDTDTSIPVLLPNFATEVRLTREELERMLRPALYDTIEALQRAIRSAAVEPADLHSVLLIGGSSRMPLVAQLVGAELGRPVSVDAHPKHAVALGAAWVAGDLMTGAPAPAPAVPLTQHDATAVAAVTSAPADDPEATRPRPPAIDLVSAERWAPERAAGNAEPALAPVAAGARAATPMITGIDDLQVSGGAAGPHSDGSQGTKGAGAATVAGGLGVALGAGTALAGSGLAGSGHAASDLSGTDLAGADVAGFDPGGSGLAVDPGPGAFPPATSWAPAPPRQPFGSPQLPPPPQQFQPQQPSGAPTSGPIPAGWGAPGQPTATSAGAAAPPSSSSDGWPPKIHPLAAGAAVPTPRQGPGSQRWIMIGAALMTALVVVVGAYFAGSSGLFGGSSPSPSAGAAGTGTPSVSAGRTSASGSAGASGSASASAGVSPSTAATASVPAAPTIYDCPTAATSDLFACLSSAHYSAGVLTIAFTANFTLTAGQDINSHHFHLFLANPNASGGTDPADAIMEHIGPAQGNWWNIYSNSTSTVDDNTKSSNGKKMSAEIGKYSLFCVRVAAGLHTLQKDKKGGLASGNCVRISK